MSISLRLRFVLVLMVTAILVVAGTWSLYILQQASALAIEQSEKVAALAGETEIREIARVTARQVEAYLARHPELDLTNVAELEANAVLRAVAVQSVGQTGYTTLFDANGIAHFHINPDLVGMNLRAPDDAQPGFPGILETSLTGSHADGYYEWKDADGQNHLKYVSIVPVGNTPLRVAATTLIDDYSQPVVETRSRLAGIQNRARIQLLLALMGVGLIVAIGASHLAKHFSQRIQQIAEAAARVAAGELTPRYLEVRSDEIGTLAQSYNTMIAQLHKLITRQEEHAEELSQYAAQLEESNRQNKRRASQLQASAQVARAVASTLDLDQLLNQVVHLISDHLGFYHTGAFLLDETGHGAVLRAANSAGGQRMLAQAHWLEVGAQSIVGKVTRSGQPHVAHDVRSDGVFFDNPDLPDTRSEIALPLIARGQTIGALDVQSTEEAAFDEEDVTVLSILADQIAIALDKARLFAASEAALTQLQAVQRVYTSEAWERFVGQQDWNFLEYRRTGLTAVGDKAPSIPDKVLDEGLTTAVTEEHGQATALIAPIKVRGMVIGALGLQQATGDGRRVWGGDDIALIETVADHVAQAMETARLYQQAQLRAQREQLVTEIASKIRSAPDVDGIMRTAVQEIRRTLGVSHGIIRLGTERHLKPPTARDEYGTAGGKGDSKNE